MSDAAALRPIEIASGLVFGPGEGDADPARSGAVMPLAALEQAILPALAKPPCLVSFSGGRDSSCVLAVATALARREGLPAPIPATNRFPDAADTDERAWQELVIERLGLDDWLRLDFGDELDAIGPVAARGLRRHGLLWPFNVHFHAPLLEAARGGSLLTGIGGDEQMGESRWRRANEVLSRRVRLRRRDVLRVGFALAPRPVRARVLRRSPPATFPWLRPAGHRELIGAWASEAASEPRRYAERLEWWPRLRSVEIGFRSLDLLAADAGTAIGHPLADRRFAAALAAAEGRNPPGDRTARMRRLFGGLLPEELLERRTKALFDGAFWGSHARALAHGWSGEGLDESLDPLVDDSLLAAEWKRPVATPQSLTLLQAAWLARESARSNATDAERPAARSPEQRAPTRAGGEAPSLAAPPA